MIESRGARGAIALVVMVCLVTVGCAGSMQSGGAPQSSGQLAVLCGAGGALAGAAVGAAVGRNWQGALIGAAVGAMAAGLSCFAFAEYKSQQVRDYGQTQQATGYQPSQGDSIRITSYEITPAAAAPGSSVAFNATYTVMTPNPDADVTVTEIRTLSVQDPTTKSWRELGRVPNQVTVKPGTRQANGKFDVRSAVAEGNYQIAFEVVKDGAKDAKSLPLVVTTQQAILTSPQARVAQVSEPGAKPLETAAGAPTAVPASVPVPPVAPAPGAGRPTVGPGSTLSSLGEQQPQAPAKAVAAAPPPAPSRTAYFVASKVSGQGSLRGGPGATYPVVGSIDAGSRYPVVQSVRASNGSWFKIRIDTGAEAWVAGSLGHVVEE